MQLTHCNIYATLRRMNTTLKRKTQQEQSWPRKVQPGRSIVAVYRRKTPSGNFAYMVANYADGEHRRFDSYASEADALAAAETLAKRLDKRDYVAASMTPAQAREYAGAVDVLAPFGVTVGAGAATLAECLKIVRDLPQVHEAISFWAARHKQVTAKPVADVVAELLKVKGARGASVRYAKDLRLRLERFAGDCNKACCNVTTAQIHQSRIEVPGVMPQ